MDDYCQPKSQFQSPQKAFAEYIKAPSDNLGPKIKGKRLGFDIINIDREINRREHRRFDTAIKMGRDPS